MSDFPWWQDGFVYMPIALLVFWIAVLILGTSEDKMPSKRMVASAQQLSDAGEDLVRLAAAKDAEIAALTEQRDRAMKVVDALRRHGNDATGSLEIEQAVWTALAALDTESSPSLPETP